METKSKIAVIVLHEIYGVNEHITSFCKTLREYNLEVICPNLLGRHAYPYSEEKVAYENFMQNISFTTAALEIQHLIENIKDRYEKIFVVGFSVGATIAWLCSTNINIHGVVGFYGSRIRNYLEVTPKCPTLLIFPEEEKSFDVNEIISSLSENVEMIQLKGQHGFCDPFSTHFNKDSATLALNETIHFLTQLSSPASFPNPQA
ncbi:dienelactone hydrolase family protein [Sporosarcina sp. HYO08]|uniref:dienelactone hydrolase family protein n=1 Tax=Sporosarcina sp. HYO08 TaxID=1759557 RepID=UPI0007987107|nr:dienelactone hydrolase family protein [Sporosarcina sp. HYO08]KXH83760.1 hypothetical protein AU377_03050 [Sporosarcina sp. HYO08]